jgi:uridine kinase
MLIQSDPKTGEPILLSSTLPHCVKSEEESANTRVLLLDSQVCQIARLCGEHC